MSDIRIEPIDHVREASRMRAPRRVLEGHSPYGYGVFQGFPDASDFREQWCASRLEAERVAQQWGAS